MMPRNSTRWNRRHADAVNAVTFLHPARRPFRLGRVGFDGGFGVKLAVLWAVGAGVPPHGRGGKPFKKLTKIDWGRVEDALGDENHIERFGSPLRLTNQARCALDAQTQFSSDLAFRHAKTGISL